jgi:hypothetical protein
VLRVVRSLRKTTLLAAATVLALACSACASSSHVEAPPWLKKNAAQMVERLDDPSAKISYVLGPFPLVVVQGHLSCASCTHFNSAPVTGATAAARYDAGTHANTEFAIVKGGFKGAVRVVCTSHGSFCESGGGSTR